MIKRKSKQTSKSEKKSTGRKKIRRDPKQTTFIKTVDHFSDYNGDTDQLQVALALSISLKNKRNDDEELHTYSSSYPNTQEKIETIKKSLQDFGLKPDSNKLSALNRKPFTEVMNNTLLKSIKSLLEIQFQAPKSRKKSRYKYVTPILYIRKPEDREKIISEKVSKVLQNSIKTKNNEHSSTRISLKCHTLQNMVCSKKRVFAINNGVEYGNEKLQLFYASTLSLSPAKNCCGCLLKSWNCIPGREPSPTSFTKSNKENFNELDKRIESLKSNNEADLEMENNKDLSINTETNKICLSPDIFADEENYTESCVTLSMTHNFSQSKYKF